MPKASNSNREPYQRTRNREEWLGLLKFYRGQEGTPPEVFQVIDFALRKIENFPNLRLPETHSDSPALEACQMSPRLLQPVSQSERFTSESEDTTETLQELRAVVQSLVAGSNAGVKPVDVDRVKSLLADLMSPSDAGHRNSIDRLSSLEAPTQYNPCPNAAQLKVSFEKNKYFIGNDEIFSIAQAIRAGKSILADGPPGTGKSELAVQIAIAMGLEVANQDHFNTLFCTPDISKDESLYAWNDGKRLLDIQLVREATSRLPFELITDIYRSVAQGTYSNRYLDLQALLRPCVLPYRTVVLVDEIDKTYPEFDSLMLEVVGQNRFEVPGYGPVGRKAFDPATSPIFVFTTNRQRELNGALARRMKPVWFDYLLEAQEAKVVEVKTALDEMDAGKIAAFFYKIRTHAGLKLHQPPSTAEVIETANAMAADEKPVSYGAIFQYHCHWCKFRRDFDMVKEKFYDKRNRSWSESII